MWAEPWLPAESDFDSADDRRWTQQNAGICPQIELARKNQKASLNHTGTAPCGLQSNAAPSRTMVIAVLNPECPRA
jgi:hypothetical protein